MEQQKNDNSLEKAASLLNQLQSQLVQYKTALDSIDSAAGATGRVSESLEGLSSTFGELNKHQVELAQSFNDTRRALIFTQQKAQQISKDLEELGQNFTRNINGVMQNATNEIERKIGETASGNEIIRKEVKLLRNILFGNIFILFFLMFAFFMYSGKSSASSDDGDIAARESVLSSEMPMTENTAPIPITNSNAAIDYLQIQVLNGCGISGIGQQFQGYLQTKRVKINNTENADHFDYLNTIIHANGSSMSEAASVAQYLGLGQERILPGNPKWRNYDMTIIIGKDYKSLGPNREVR